MPRAPKTPEQTAVPAPTAEAPKTAVSSEAAKELAAALVQAIELTRPTPKKNPFNRKVGTPWTPKDGSAKIKLRRKVFQHGMPVENDITTNEDITLMNRLRPGTFLDGHVRVLRRKDRGLDIDYPIRTAAQRLKLSSNFGITSFRALLERLVEEGENPQLYKVDDVDQD